MTNIREFLRQETEYSVFELQDERLDHFEFHNIGHLRAIGTIERWANEDGATREGIFERALKEVERLDAFIEGEDAAFENLEEHEKDVYEFSKEYHLSDGKRCLFNELLIHFGIIESDNED